MLAADRIDTNGAMTRALLANLLTSGDRRFAPSEFLPVWDAEAEADTGVEEQDPETIVAIFKSLKARHEQRRRKAKRGARPE